MADESLPHHRNTPTSEDAASSKADDVLKDRWRFYDRIRWAGPYGVTDEEVHAFFGLSHGPRFSELARVGLIVRTDRTRPTGSGQQSAVWIASELFLTSSPQAAYYMLTDDG